MARVGGAVVKVGGADTVGDSVVGARVCAVGVRPATGVLLNGVDARPTEEEGEGAGLTAREIAEAPRRTSINREMRRIRYLIFIRSFAPGDSSTGISVCRSKRYRF
jgi:hypothetical protein